MRANYLTAADAFGDWHEDLLSGDPPKLYAIGEGELGRIEVGPGLVTLFGGAPGAGKTAFVMQAVIDALRLSEGLRAVVLNVEMPPSILLDRQLARLSGIPAEDIRYRRLGAEHGQRIDAGLTAIERIADRLCFVRPPFTLENLAATADAFKGGLLVLDYIQRIEPPGHSVTANGGDRRGAINATMNYLRQFTDAGAAVVVVAAVGRSKTQAGRSTYASDTLSLASFRESSELEFGADDAFILSPDDNCQGSTCTVTLRHLKARHTEPRDLRLQFDRTYQRFTVNDGSPGHVSISRSAVADLRTRSKKTDDR